MLAFVQLIYRPGGQSSQKKHTQLRASTQTLRADQQTVLAAAQFSGRCATALEPQLLQHQGLGEVIRADTEAARMLGEGIFHLSALGLLVLFVQWLIVDVLTVPNLANCAHTQSVLSAWQLAEEVLCPPCSHPQRVSEVHW